MSSSRPIPSPFFGSAAPFSCLVLFCLCSSEVSFTLLGHVHRYLFSLRAPSCFSSAPPPPHIQVDVYVYLDARGWTGRSFSLCSEEARCGAALDLRLGSLRGCISHCLASVVQALYGGHRCLSWEEGAEETNGLSPDLRSFPPLPSLSAEDGSLS